MNDATTAENIHEHDLRAVAAWLFVICGMIFAMVVLGGVTRLTESGLSMVDWRPITGWLPPMTDSEWAKVFADYRTSPEYKYVNAGMTLGDFKEIFWLEYLHRLFGRIIGLVFFLPFMFFLVTKRLDKALRRRCWIMFVLGGLQGVLGWYMVKSGLVDEPDVSQYRLAAHLGLALVIYLYILWTAWGIVLPRPHVPPPGQARDIGRSAALLGLIFVTVLSGALVAGLDAGLLYNTFPLMDGRLVPEGAFELQPFHLNFFENRATVQFDHRVLALITVVAVVVYWLHLQRNETHLPLKRAGHLLLLAVVAQAGLGIATLIHAVPIALGALHQAGAVLLLTAGLWLVHQTRR